MLAWHIHTGWDYLYSYIHSSFPRTAGFDFSEEGAINIQYEFYAAINPMQIHWTNPHKNYGKETLGVGVTENKLAVT